VTNEQRKAHKRMSESLPSRTHAVMEDSVHGIRISPKTKELMRKLIDEGKRIKEICEECDVAPSTVSRYKRGLLG
jgi:DNA-binding NarL/FixJ family response regulator